MIHMRSPGNLIRIKWKDFQIFIERRENRIRFRQKNNWIRMVKSGIIVKKPHRGIKVDKSLFRLRFSTHGGLHGGMNNLRVMSWEWGSSRLLKPVLIKCFCKPACSI